MTYILNGYADRWSVSPGDTIRFMVSSPNALEYHAEIVRLRQPQAGPEASRFDPEPVNAPCNGTYSARYQSLPIGSLAIFPHPELILEGSFSLVAYIRPTTPLKGRQALIGAWSDGVSKGFGLEIGVDGALQLRIGDDENCVCVSSGVQMTERWYRVAATFDAQHRKASLLQEPLTHHDFHNEATVWVTADVECRPKAEAIPFTMAAWPDQRIEGPSAWGGWAFTNHLNGRIDHPAVTRCALAREEIASFHANPCNCAFADSLVAAWDFACDIESDAIIDQGPHCLNGVVLNQPARAMPGHAWDGDVTDWRTAPARYGAIHFHDDDLVDARWDPDFTFTVPTGMRSGVYAAHLSCASRGEFWVPFVVRPVVGQHAADVVLLLPTATYIAYQNHRSRFMSLASERLHGRLALIDAVDAAFLETPEMGLSTYDRHADGSGVAYASQHRPAQNIRPDGRLWNFNVDLFIVDWLEGLGLRYDVVTDEDLHREGADLVAPYRVLITGSHPEYASTPMLNALESYLRRGGRMMYMGGNGFYWRIAFHPTRRGVIEVRRTEGVRAWDAEPGSAHMSFTGERSGLWRHSGRAPQRLVGVGFVGQGFDQCTYYRRTAESRDPRVEWVFVGIDGDVIGDFGVLQGGAAGIEVDACDIRLGTPRHAIVLARSENHSNTYQRAVEDILVPHGATDALLDPDICAELTFFETYAGGAVFSAGSIAFAGALGWNGFDNDIFRLATNILNRFLDLTPFAGPRGDTPEIDVS